MSPALTLRLSRRPDGAVVFELRRADGSATWQKRAGPTAEFFAVHDLTHYAVESTLGFSRGFYGLVAEGWDLTDFGMPWPHGPLPTEALPVELIVGAFDAARAAHEPLTAERCNAAAADWYGARGESSPVHVTDTQLDAVRTLLADVVGRWRATGSGEELVLEFPAPVR